MLEHHSRLLSDRKPYGALAAGTRLELTVRLTAQHAEDIKLSYAYGLKTFVTSYQRLEPVAGQKDCFGTTVVMPKDPGLFFYWFEFKNGKQRLYLTRDPASRSGGGLISDLKPQFMPEHSGQQHPWQVTVYGPQFFVPDWLKGKVVYQIFPDRFNRDRDFNLERFTDRERPERIYHADWRSEVDIAGRPETGYISCDFFGGSLKGITEKMDYIHNLGIAVIYLNPIFAARSNHRYDTADFFTVDPLLGDLEDFRTLCRTADRLGVRIILDGVFNHTGADSIYFNKYNRYPDTGAWQEINGQGRSQYGSWFDFYRENDRWAYPSWWGFTELPVVRKDDLAYRDFILGENGVIRYWLRQGAAGWRLDVSDELPDDFIRQIRRAAKEEKNDAVIIGEVWEDASNKISYGFYRDFLMGRTHDAVMNYPFQEAVSGWLTYRFDAGQMNHLLETMRENYPPPAFQSVFNLISSHDITRAITRLAGDPDPGDRREQALLHLSAKQRERGTRLLRLAVLLQMIYPGCPVIYYGDEAGMEGYRDPFNRRTYPWGQEDQALIDFVAFWGRLRRRWSVLQTGDLNVLTAEKDILVLERCEKNTQPAQVIAALNRSDQSVAVQIRGQTVLIEPLGFYVEADQKTVVLPE